MRRDATRTGGAHPDDLLLPYALGELDPAEAREVEAHLDGCGRCRDEVAALRAGVVATVEELPPVAPPPSAWENVERRVRTRQVVEGRPRRRAPRMLGWGLAAGVLVAAGLGWWGWDAQRDLAALRREHTTVTRWMSNPQARTVPLAPIAEAPVGSVVTLPDGRSLIVMREAPPEGSSYQAWGLRPGEAVSLGVSGGRTLEVRGDAFDMLIVSLEPAGGSEAPTTVLGTAPPS